MNCAVGEVSSRRTVQYAKCPVTISDSEPRSDILLTGRRSVVWEITGPVKRKHSSKIEGHWQTSDSLKTSNSGIVNY